MQPHNRRTYAPRAFVTPPPVHDTSAIPPPALTHTLVPSHPRNLLRFITEEHCANETCHGVWSVKSGLADSRLASPPPPPGPLPTPPPQPHSLPVHPQLSRPHGTQHRFIGLAEMGRHPQGAKGRGRKLSARGTNARLEAGAKAMHVRQTYFFDRWLTAAARIGTSHSEQEGMVHGAIVVGCCWSRRFCFHVADLLPPFGCSEPPPALHCSFVLGCTVSRYTVSTDYTQCLV